MSPGHHGGRIAELIPGVVVGSPTSTVVVAEATAFEELPAAATRSEPTFGLSGSFVEPQILFGLTEALFFLTGGQLRAFIPGDVRLLVFFKKILLIVGLNSWPPTPLG